MNWREAKTRRRMLADTAAAVALAANAPAQQTGATVQRSPIAGVKNGFTLEQSKKALSEHDLPQWMAGGDTSVWLNFHVPEVLPTVVVPNRQATRELPKAIDSTIGEIKADTGSLGTLTLDRFMANPRFMRRRSLSRTKAKSSMKIIPACSRRIITCGCPLPKSCRGWSSIC